MSYIGSAVFLPSMGWHSDITVFWYCDTNIEVQRSNPTRRKDDNETLHNSSSRVMDSS